MPIDRQRKTVTFYGRPLYIDWEPVETVIELLRKEAAELEAMGGSDIKVILSPCYDEATEVKVICTMPESDDQMNLRISREEAWEAREKAQYLKLKEKFGDA